MSAPVILAMDLSTSHGHVVAWSGGQTLYEMHFTSERSHNSLLYSPLGEALDMAGNRLALLVVGTGPGSYTGVRISIAAAHGLALSRGVPVIGLPSIASLDDAPHYRVVGDARRGKYYRAQVEHGRLLGGVALGGEEETRAWIAASSCPVFTADEAPPFADLKMETRRPCALRLAMTASTLGEETIWTLSEKGVEPFYVQEAFITKAKPKNNSPG